MKRRVPHLALQVQLEINRIFVRSAGGIWRARAYQRRMWAQALRRVIGSLR